MGFSDEFTMVVNSNENLFGDCTSTDFKSTLNRVMAFGLPYEVALSEIFFKEPPPPPPDSPSELKSYFGLFPEENKITLTTTVKSGLQLPKTITTIDTFLAVLKMRMEDAFPLMFQIAYTYDGDVIPKTTIKLIDPTNQYKLIISPPIMAEMLGFESNTFSPGTHVSVRPVDKEVWPSIPMHDNIHFDLTKTTVKTVTVEEPDEYKVDLLLINCATALITSDWENIEMPYDDDTTILRLVNPYQGLSIKFPAPVNEAIGLDEEYEFNKPLTEFNITEKRKQLAETRIKHHPGHQVLVHTTTIDSGGVYGSRLANLLRIFPRKPSNEVQHLIFQPLNFYPLKYQQLDIVDIKLTTENLKPIAPSEVPTTLILTFRPMRKISCLDGKCELEEPAMAPQSGRSYQDAETYIPLVVKGKTSIKKRKSAVQQRKGKISTKQSGSGFSSVRTTASSSKKTTKRKSSSKSHQKKRKPVVKRKRTKSRANP